MYIYSINYSGINPGMNADWYSDEWNGAETAELLSIRPESSIHIPATRVKMLYGAGGISGIFTVDDNYLVCASTRDMSQVWMDSCVEFFVKPFGAVGYFNFEFNCAGALYASYIKDCRRTADGFADFQIFSVEECAAVKRKTSLTAASAVELKEPVEWSLQFFIPFTLFEEFGVNIDTKGEWSCNFNKCADNSSHPHWISWAPLKELNFHAPESFGKLLFKI